MARDPAVLVRQGVRALARPWPLLLTGLAVVALGVILQETSATPLRVVCLVGGLVMAGLAVARRLQTASQDLEERVESAGVVAVAAFAALLASLGCGPRDDADKIPHNPAELAKQFPEGLTRELVRRSGEDWDSIGMVLGVLVGVGLFGSLLVLLPRTPRRVVASLLVLFHFGGITVAVTSVAPRDQPAPWVSQQLWIRLYRPYLTFMYLTNAYHFYSPDPGPPSLLWFRVEYADKTYRWIKLPVRQESPIALHYQRGLALAEYTNNPMPRLPPYGWEKALWLQQLGLPEPRFGHLATKEEKAKFRQTGWIYDHETWEELYQSRQMVAQRHPLLAMPTDLFPNLQYQEPQHYVKLIVESYARHIARTSPHPENPEVHVRSVRVYRVRHDIIAPSQLAEGMDPRDPVFYKPVYLGQFDPDGHMLGTGGKRLFDDDGDRITDANGLPVDDLDPLLYWYVPMAYVPANFGQDNKVPLISGRPRQSGDKFLDGVKIHAGDIQDLTDLKDLNLSDQK
jgi:hypothetical protein